MTLEAAYMLIFLLPPSLSFYSVHAHAAAALINFCEGVECNTLLPYLDPIVERLLKLLNPPPNSRPVKRYVQEQAITTLAMVADASEATFARVMIFPTVFMLPSSLFPHPIYRITSLTTQYLFLALLSYYASITKSA
jgi:hypothetical protein